ncbi:uncharacterized protein J8A68_006088 [[Candida] subhashii]|uniref:Cullin family profile domain-containing protein n=2 Tax=[Candida] subhashii TaxID=561895 RepID=A0A8J5QEP9_9ASCO|nr:uncharacterized protein J8A68_006088 [[Candida] subhashii]KAG7660405.1 hypothetical protein J8A68_006088 [[Candida] subhashii]
MSTNNLLYFSDQSSSPTPQPPPPPNKRIPSHLSTRSFRSSDSLDDDTDSISTTTTTTSHTKRHRPNDQPSHPTYPDNIRILLEQAQKTAYGAAEAILTNDGKLGQSFQGTYRAVEQLCRFKHEQVSKLADYVLGKVESEFRHSILGKIKNEVPWENADDVRQIVAGFLEVYENWDERVRKLSKVFLYLDRGYLFGHWSKPTIIECATDNFVKYVLDANYVNEEGDEDEVDGNPKELCIRTLDAHNRLLKQCREFQDPGDIELCQRFTKLLNRLHKSQTPAKFDFHTQLLNEIIGHYDQLKEDWICDKTYISKVSQQIIWECQYFKSCGKSNEFLGLLYKKLLWHLLFYDFSTILKESFGYYLLENENVEELNKIYKYCGKTKSYYSYDSINIFIFEWGVATFTGFENILETYKTKPGPSSSDCIIAIAELYNRYKKSGDLISNGNEKLEFELRNSLSKAINLPKYNMSIILQLCKYCDSYFKTKKPSSSTSSSYDTFITNAMIVFKVINNKQDFMLAYKKDLSRRLLLSRTPDIPQEQKLAQEFINLIGETDDDSIALRVMFSDLELSHNYATQFKPPITSGILFNPVILDQKFWPEIPKQETKLVLPEELADILTGFTEEYRTNMGGSRFQNRKLDWTNYKLHQLSIIGHFDSGDKEITGNLLQVSVILLFNERNSYYFQEILTRTEIEEKLLRRVLDSLISEKYPLLKHTPDDEFIFNSRFADKSTKIKLPMIKDKAVAVAEKQQEGDIVALIERNRIDEYKSMIMKLMKSAKHIRMTDLLTLSIEALEKRNPVTIQDLKTSIESLIETEYLKREDKDMISYIA